MSCDLHKHLSAVPTWRHYLPVSLSSANGHNSHDSIFLGARARCYQSRFRTDASARELEVDSGSNGARSVQCSGADGVSSLDKAGLYSGTGQIHHFAVDAIGVPESRFYSPCLASPRLRRHFLTRAVTLLLPRQGLPPPNTVPAKSLAPTSQVAVAIRILNTGVASQPVLLFS